MSSNQHRSKLFITVIIAIPLLFSFISCKRSNHYYVDISSMSDVDINIYRYDVDLMEIDTSKFTEDIMKLSDKYSVFLGNVSKDTSGIYRIKDFIEDPDIISITSDCLKVFPKKDEFESLRDAFRHIKYYIPNVPIPDIFSYISGFDSESPIIYNNDKLIIALDMYLGSDYQYYKTLGLPMYRIRRFDRAYLERDCIFQIADALNVDESSSDKLLDWMIYYGKNLEFTKMMIPQIPDSCLLGYTANQLKWCEDNEDKIWRFLIDNEKLYTSDIMLIRKFIDDGPFTSFFSHDAPAELGRYIGWKIVSEYMKNNKISIYQLMQESDNQKILSKSHYRP